MFLKHLILIAFVLTTASQLQSQDVYGCTDPKANNYNAQATLNDGSCSYSTTFYNPTVRYNLPEIIQETSGLAFFNGGLWTINDSGHNPVLYRLDSTDGSVVQMILVNDANNVDWEDLAQDEDYLYVGDFGNNVGNRDDLGIYRIKKSDIPLTGNGEVGSEFTAFTYSDYVLSSKKSLNNFDCEAFLEAHGKLYLFTKNRGDFRTKMYQLPKEPGNYVAELLQEFDVKGLVTAADYSQINEEVVLLGYTDFPYTPFVWLLFNYQGDDFFSGNKRRIDMPNLAATQTEGFAYTFGRHGIISSEKTVLGPQRAFNMDTRQWTNMSPSDVFEYGKADFDFVISPNPISKGKLSLLFKDLPNGSYEIEVFDTSANLLVVKKHWAKNNKEGIRIKLKVSHLKPGMYIVRVMSKNVMLEKKFIKVNND